MKTAEEILKEAFDKAKVKYPDEPWVKFEDQKIEIEFCTEAMGEYATQEKNAERNKAIAEAITVFADQVEEMRKYRTRPENVSISLGDVIKALESLKVKQ